MSAPTPGALKTMQDRFAQALDESPAGAFVDRPLAPSHSQRQALPVVAEQTIRLLALFDAFRAAPFGSLMLHESSAPGAAAALTAWAAAVGVESHDQMMVTEVDAYVNRTVNFPGHAYVTVIRYRAMTDEEIEAYREQLGLSGEVKP